MDNIAPCPFCGSRDVAGCYEILNSDSWYCLKCTKCGAIVTFDDKAAETIFDVQRLYSRRA